MHISQAGKLLRPRRHAGILILAAASAVLALAPYTRSEAQAQTAAAGWRVPRAGRVVVAAPSLRTEADMDRFAAAHPNLAAAAHLDQVPRPTMAPAAYAAAKAAAEAQAISPLAKPAIPTRNGTSALHPLVSPATLVLNKPGPNQTQANNVPYPPDTTGAIGTTQIVFMVNGSLNVYARINGKLLKTTGLQSFFGTTDDITLPRIVYDPIWNRWVLVATRIPKSGDTQTACFLLAVSNTSSASGSWIVFGDVCQGGPSFAAGDLWDYPQLGLSQDAILVTGNLFNASGTFKGPVLAPLPKALAYNSQGFSFPDFAPGTQFGTLAPPNVQDSHAKAFFLAIDNSTNTVVDLFAGANLSNEFDATFTMQAQITVPAYTVPPAAKQPNTTTRLDTLDGRFQQASAQYSNKLWNIHTENYAGFPVPHFYEIDTSANSLIQDGGFYESSTSSDFNPSITANSSGDAFVTWTTTNTDPSNPVHQAAMRVSGRKSTDSAGVIDGTGLLIATSPRPLTANLSGKLALWGFYSNVALDPVASSCGAGQRVAAFNELTLNNTDWSSRFAIVGFCQ